MTISVAYLHHAYAPAVSYGHSALCRHRRAARFQLTQRPIDVMPTTVLDGAIHRSASESRVEWKTPFFRKVQGVNVSKVVLGYQNSVYETRALSVRCKDPRKIDKVLEML